MRYVEKWRVTDFVVLEHGPPQDALSLEPSNIKKLLPLVMSDEPLLRDFEAFEAADKCLLAGISRASGLWAEQGRFEACVVFAVTVIGVLSSEEKDVLAVSELQLRDLRCEFEERVDAVASCLAYIRNGFDFPRVWFAAVKRPEFLLSDSFHPGRCIA